MRLAILADGEPPVHPTALAVLARAERLVCCDGAYRKALALREYRGGRLPDLVVGDGDSLTATERQTLGDRFVHVSEQETNDLDKAFRVGVRRFGAEGVVILGAGGLREDHFLGNVFRLPELAVVSPDIELVTNAGEFTVVVGERTYCCRPGEAVSVFAPIPGTRVKSEGLEWPLGGVSLDALWKGTLNRTTASSFKLRCNHPLLVYRPHC